MERARTTSVTLGDHYVKFLEDTVATGRYGSASEVMREALRLFEKQLDFEAFVRSRPRDDEQPEDEKAFLEMLEERRKEPLTDHETVMAAVWKE